MKKLIVAVLLFAAPAFANGLTPNTVSPDAQVLSDEVAAPEDSMFADEVLDADFEAEFTSPDDPNALERPRPWRAWMCIAADRMGRRFVGRSFIPGQARRIALQECRQSSHRPGRHPWPHRGCHIVRCFNR